MPRPLGLRPFARVIEAEASPFGCPSCHPRPVAPDPGGDLSLWRIYPWHDAHSSLPVCLTTDPTEIGAVLVETLRSKATEWVRPSPNGHPESVILDPLLMRAVGRPGGAFSDGRSQALRSDLDVPLILATAVRALGASCMADLTGLPDRTVRYLASRRPRASTVGAATAGLQMQLGPDPLPRLLDLVGDLSCAMPGCSESPRRRSRTCSERHRKAVARRSRVTSNA